MRKAMNDPIRETVDAASELRARLLSGLSVSERRVQFAGISTPVVEGGDGPPLVLLHGPAEFAGNWMRVMPDLLATHRVIAPDLPGHGASRVTLPSLDPDHVLAWLDDLIQQTCSSPPVVVGHTVGGAIAVRYAVDHGSTLKGLVLVDALGLAPFAPDPAFGAALMQFVERPTEDTYDRFMQLCAYDLDLLKGELDELWEPFAAYNLALAQTPSAMAAMNALIEGFGMTEIPATDLATIACPVSLIWGRHDRATSLSVAEAVAERHGWPLHVVEDAADDPARDQPAAFLSALHHILEVDVEVGL
jgi:pimeloyl-ACP methyl ester carboxylesterase